MNENYIVLTHAIVKTNNLVKLIQASYVVCVPLVVLFPMKDTNTTQKVRYEMMFDKQRELINTM